MEKIKLLVVDDNKNLVDMIVVVVILLWLI